MFTQGSLMYTGTLCGKINSFSLQNQKVKKIGIQVNNSNVLEKLCEVLPIASLVKNLHSIKGQHAWVTYTVGIRQ